MTHPDGDPPTITLAAEGEIAVLYQRDGDHPQGGVIQAHGSRDHVESAWRAMWPALMRSPGTGTGRLADQISLETFPIRALDGAMVDEINATLSGQASPVTLRARLTQLGLPER